MESSPSSRLSFFTPTGKFIESPIEGLDCGIAVAIPKEREAISSLKLGTTALPLWFGEDSLCALSAWPACGPGQYKISLESGDIRERRIITVIPQHFTETEFKAILYDLIDVLPLSIATALQKCGAMASMNLVTVHYLSVEQEFYRLRDAIRGTKDRMGILQLLPMIQRECYQTLIPRHELRKTNKARRPDISKIHQAMSMPGNISSGGNLHQMFDVTVERTYETYENRLVKAYVQALQSQLARLLLRVEEEQIAAANVKEIQDLFNDFRMACARIAFLKQVRLPFTSAGRVTMVLLKKPAYRAVLEDYLSLFKAAPVRLEEPALNTPLNRFPYLYQLWAGLKLVNVTMQTCAEAGYRCINHKWLKRDNDGYFFETMKDKTAAIELSNPNNGKIVKLMPWHPAGGQAAASHRQDMPPALAVGIYAAGKPPVVLLFDASYNVAGANAEMALPKPSSAQVKTAEELSSIQPLPEHVEELRRCIEATASPVGVREIQYAAILYPGLRRQILPGFEALPARPADGQELEKILGETLRRFLI